MEQSQDKNMEAVVERVRKLLNLAAKNPNEHEAAAAAEKAQALLASYNLDMATIGQGGESGKREDAKQRGGMYIYERELWNAIASLNFCMYFTTRGRMKNGAGKMQFSFQHRIVGRTVNVVSTKAMAEYLQGAIERLCRERFPLNNQFFMREAVAFREGMSDKITVRLRDKRDDALEAEEKKKRAAAKKAKASGVNTAFALTLTDVKETERIANYDFLNGEGAWARREAAREQWSKEAAEARAEQAKAEAAADAAYAQWAAANPEEAAKEAAKAKKRQEAEAAKSSNRYRRRSYRDRAPTAREKRQNSDYYDDGYQRGGEISLDQQVGDRSNQRRIGR